MGQLSKAKLMVVEKASSLDGTSVEFMFNPTEYSVSKSNKWELKGNKSGNVPKWEFGGGEPRQMNLDLFFDASLPRTGGSTADVRKATNQLFNFMMIDPNLKQKSQNSKLGQPPKCGLFWGKDSKDLFFHCYIMSCSVTYTMFDETGIPIRATAKLVLKEALDPKEKPPQNPTSLGEPGRRAYTVQEGDRLDWIAYQEYGNATMWRRIAEANRISNPLDLQAGTVLAIPPF